ncbi:MAG: carboxyl transferase domain-containing protein [Acidimicrobiales bacterium]
MIRSAAEFVGLLADPGVVESWDCDLLGGDPLGFVDSRPYLLRLGEARSRTGETEAVWTGQARIDGRPVVLVVCEFAFLGGSMGVAVGERVTRAFERAGASQLPVVAVVASGGVRMQEGVFAFMQMAKTADAVSRYRQAGGRYLVYLAGPATGGVLASWGSLAQFTFAAPGAFVGLSGPRVLEATLGQRLPDGVQQAERLFECGLVDELVAPDHLRGRLIEVLGALDGPARRADPDTPIVPPQVRPARRNAWSVIERSRDPSRPGATELLDSCGHIVFRLRGAGEGGGDDAACLAALAWVQDTPVMVVAQVRDGTRPASLGPRGYRKALRAMRLAAELGIPLVTIIDTSGAEASIPAEEGGLAAQIAGCLATLSSIAVPTLAVLLGQGTGAGAIALLPADRVVAAEQAWLAPLAPEGSSALLYRTSEHAPEVAARQRVTAAELADQGIVDVVVPELPDAAAEPRTFLARLAAQVVSELDGLVNQPPDERLMRRRRRYRSLGTDPTWPANASSSRRSRSISSGQMSEAAGEGWLDTPASMTPDPSAQGIGGERGEHASYRRRPGKVAFGAIARGVSGGGEGIGG